MLTSLLLCGTPTIDVKVSPVDTERPSGTHGKKLNRACCCSYCQEKLLIIVIELRTGGGAGEVTVPIG